MRPALIFVAILSAGLGLAFPAAAQESGSPGAQPEITGSTPSNKLETQPLAGKPLKEVTVGGEPSAKCRVSVFHVGRSPHQPVREFVCAEAPKPSVTPIKKRPSPMPPLRKGRPIYASL
ncbi:hypothetical protein [Microvirga massiliensis]|uniref:hypothetical protein n=1 Tax=Microvirga massiliensis TaxID=1033741 RepID=UPI00062B77B6|nr:hypothetical protein [Microvirga massiliensis]